MLSYNELMKKYKDEKETKTAGPSRPKTTGTKKTAGPSAPTGKTTKTAEKSHGTAGNSRPSSSAGQVSSVSAKKNIPDTNLFKGLTVSKPEKKKLSGSDKDVFKRASALAADTGMSYAERKKQITQTQKELGKIRDKHLIASMMGNENAKKTIKQVTDLQNQLSQQLKSTAFGAGFGQAAGLDIYDTAVKKAAEKTGNTSLTARMKAQDDARAQVKAANEKSYGRGELAGELTQAAILYGTAGAAAEKAALAGMGRLTGGKTLGKAGTFATRMLGQQTADTVVNTPLTIAKGMEEGKDRGEIAEDVGKQFAMDAAFNLGMGAIGAGAKAAGKAIGKAKESKAAVKTAREEAQREMLEAAAKTPAPTAAQKRKALLSEEDLPELAKEYQLMQDENWWSAKMAEVSQRYGDDTAGAMKEIEGLQARQAELEDMLGIKTKKVQQMEKSLKTQAVKKAESILSLSGTAQKEEARKLMSDAMNEAMRGGQISRETRERIFGQLFEGGSVSNRELIDKELKDWLKNMRLTISKQDAGDIADFGAWRKSTMGKLGGVKVADRGDIDVRYMELSDRYPEYFPADIVVPSEQLQRIAEVAEGLKYSQIPLAETVDDGMKAGMREEFDAAMDQLEGEVAKITRYTNERAEKQISKLLRQGQLPDYSRADTDSMKALYDERRQLRKEAEKIRNKVNLTEGDKLVLQKLLRGEIKEAEARQLTGINADDLMKLYAVEQPLRKVENSIRGYKEYVSRNAYEGAKGIVGEMNIRGKGVEGWRDLGPMRLMRETQERILDMIAPTKEKAKEITEYLFAPVHENERLRTLFKNDFIDRIKATGISTKNNITVRKADGSTAKTSESALVQYLGESRYQLQKYAQRKGWATAEDVAAELQLQREVQVIEASLTAEQLEKISRGIDEMTAIYKEIHPKINEVLIRNGYDPIGYIEGYFPHMSFDDPDNIMEMAAKKLGFDFASKELPMDIAGRTEGFRPGKKWSGNLLERKGTQTDYDALRAFDMYIDNISDVIYHTDDIKRLRAYEDYIRYTLSDEGIKENVDAIRARTDISIDEKMELIEKEYGKSQEHTLQNYVSNVRLYTDLLAGKKHNIDRILETHLFGRKVYKVISEIENRVAGNMVAGNIGSAMTNFIPITQGMSSMSTKSNLQGLKEALEYMSKAEMDDLTKKSAFLTTREGSDLLYKTTLREISDKASSMMTLADRFSTQAVWRSRYYDNMAKGMTEDAAIKNADEFARNLFGGRSKGAMPTAFSAKALKPLTMFQLEVNNQLSYLLKDIPKDAQKDVRKMMKAYSGIIIGAYVYNDVYEKLTGRRSALDPFGIANEAMGDLTGTQVRNSLDILGDAISGEGLQLTEETDKQKPAQMITALTEEVGGNVPFVGGLLFEGGRIPMSSALPSGTSILGAIGNMATGADTAEKGLQTIRKEAEKPFWYMAMPFAGGQVKKTLQGLETMKEGGSYNQTNDGPELQFAVDQESKGEWAKSLLFGQWATEGGKAYVEDRSQMLSANQTETYKKLVGAGVKNTVAFEEISKIRMESKSRDKRNAIRRSNLSEDQKATLYYDLVAEEGSKDREILDWYEGRESRGKVADCLLRMADHSGANAERSVLRYCDLSDADKEYIYLQKISSTDKDQTRITELKKAGMGMDDFLSIRNKYSALNDASMGGKEKKATFLQWMKDQGYNASQIAKIKENFAFSGGYTVKW